MTWLGSGSRAGSHCSERTRCQDFNGDNWPCEIVNARKTLTDILVSLLRMTWRRWGGRMGGALRCSSGLKTYCSCPYGPGGELDRSADKQQYRVFNSTPYGHILNTREMRCWPDVSEHSKESTCRASNTSKSDFFTWIRLLMVPSWLVTTGWKKKVFKQKKRT